MTDFPVAAANTAEAVTGLFWLEVAKMFFPLGVPEVVDWEPTPPDATKEDSVGAVDPVGMMLVARGIDAAGTDEDEEDVDEEEEEMVLLLVVAVLCFGSI